MQKHPQNNTWPMLRLCAAWTLLRSLNNTCQFLRKHHVAFDLQLSAHERLHSIKLTFSHGNHISIRDCDRAVCFWVFTNSRRPRTILKIQSEFAFWARIADHKLKD